MKTLIILMFIMLIVLLALNVTLYIRFNKRVNHFEDLFINTFKPYGDDITSLYSHINSIYQTIKDLMDSNLKIKAILDSIKLEHSNINNQITTYVHKDNDANKKELINCMANSFTDMRTHILSVMRDINKNKNLNINDELLADIKECLISVQQTLGDTNLDIKTISDKELTEISSMLKNTQNWCNYISKQIEACNKLKTATKSKSTKSDKPDAKKKAPLL